MIGLTRHKKLYAVENNMMSQECIEKVEIFLKGIIKIIPHEFKTHCYIFSENMKYSQFADIKTKKFTTGKDFMGRWYYINEMIEEIFTENKTVVTSMELIKDLKEKNELMFKMQLF